MSVTPPSPISKKLFLAIGVGLLALSSALGAHAAGKDGDAGFDRDAAMNAMKSVDIGKCKKAKGPTGDGHVIVTFAPGGTASDATVDQAPFAGTKVGKCIATQYKKAKVPAFQGTAVSVGKKFQLQ